MCLDLNSMLFFNCYIQIRGGLLTDGTWLLRSNSRPKGDERQLSWYWPCSHSDRAHFFGFFAGCGRPAWITSHPKLHGYPMNQKVSTCYCCPLFYPFFFISVPLFLPKVSAFLERIHFLVLWGFLQVRVTGSCIFSAVINLLTCTCKW